MCAYDFFTLQHLLTHSHSHDNINNHNDDKTVDVENKVVSDNAPENNVGGVLMLGTTVQTLHVTVVGAS